MTQGDETRKSGRKDLQPAPHPPKVRIDKALLRGRTEAGMSVRAIAKELGVSPKSVSLAQKRLGLQKKQQAAVVVKEMERILKRKVWNKIQGWTVDVEAMIFEVTAAMETLMNVEAYYKDQVDTVESRELAEEYLLKIKEIIWDKTKLTGEVLTLLGVYEDQVIPKAVRFQLVELMRSFKTPEQAEALMLGVHKVRDESIRIREARSVVGGLNRVTTGSGGLAKPTAEPATAGPAGDADSAKR